ncbi:alpha/beta hydrolase [Noviherbaspirillum sp. CPCC 100848]|uniref:Alpha/beta hydrolase n=1 Tax=Noviherbaspirillum album TaxID=3080276 RepID=A0ABU6JHG7_9BURK|nr:alpha/beta hydrolase [Noviherbaspirillum sp. CPCC 100848]MEC4723086.1 alpha/beta hydrolase [Noviherbaspirillum sp. CPCC 100848]
MFYPNNGTSASPFLFALEPYHAVCNYLAGQMNFSGSLMQGDGHPVLVIPGLAASGAATLDLRTRLRDLGYAVYDWKHGINGGHGHDLEGWMRMLGRQVEELHDRHHSPISIVGWSLGGAYARELGHRHPSRIRQVITLATPFGLMGESSLSESSGMPVRSTSIYSQTDGIVSWEKCVGPESGQHRNIEVNGVSHFGMVHHPEILGVIAGLLGEPVMEHA